MRIAALRQLHGWPNPVDIKSLHAGIPVPDASYPDLSLPDLLPPDLLAPPDRGPIPETAPDQGGDRGPDDRDSGPLDSTAADAPAPDGGSTAPGDEGCNCGVATTPPPWPPLLMLALGLAKVTIFRTRKRHDP